jgi:hypothetical protein
LFIDSDPRINKTLNGKISGATVRVTRYVKSNKGTPALTKSMNARRPGSTMRVTTGADTRVE